MRKRDLTGLKFNMLTVLRESSKKQGKKTYWECRCDCGNVTTVSTDKLTTLHTLSCGCKKQGASVKNLIGQTFGSLTVTRFSKLDRHKAYWVCKCICGKEVEAIGKLLLRGSKTSCGCRKGKARIIDLTGKRYGKLTVIKQAEDKGKPEWECLCDCGKTVVVAGGSLRSGNTRSCGCLKHDIVQRIDLTGRVFGRLTVVKYTRTVEKNAYWLCLCSCGRTRELKSIDLLHNGSCSCGCAQSMQELEVYDYVCSVYNGNVIHKDRSLICPFELDVYAPEAKLAVEVDGLYWHSEARGRDSKYHLMKTEKCIENGVRLIHIYDWEWIYKTDIVKSVISSAFGVYNKKIYARECTVGVVSDRAQVQKFFNENHIQGAVLRYSLCLGLYYDGELVQACVFGKQHFGRDGGTELYRMVTLKYTQVLGGFSRLMAHCPYDSVVSYVSRRLFDASGYLSGGWVVEGTSAPSFFLTDGQAMYSRHLGKKAAMLKRFDDLDPSMTEREMQQKHKLYRVWDCGTLRVRWHRQECGSVI